MRRLLKWSCRLGTGGEPGPLDLAALRSPQPFPLNVKFPAMGCSGGKFVVPWKDEAYDVRARGSDREWRLNWWMTLVLPGDAPYPRYAPNRSSTGQIWAIEVTMLNVATIAARGGLIEPGDPSYEVARKVYNGMLF